MLLCDLTQSYSPHGGGGISTYLREKQNYILNHTPHSLLQIVPGPETRIVENGRHIWVEVSAPPVRGSEHYRFILDTRPVHQALEHFRPHLIESQCPWILPWTAINYRRAHPTTALVAGYHTDFPNAHVHRVASGLFGPKAAAGLRKLTINYAYRTYRCFDRIYALGHSMRDTLLGYGLSEVDILDLGVDTTLFDPSRRDQSLRAKFGLSAPGPLLVYAGRMDNEKRADKLLELMRELPESFGASLLMLGEGKLLESLRHDAQNMRVALPGFEADRTSLAVALASSDIYVSAMADETFGISIIEAQASGLPVVGVASGAMPERVIPGTGLLGPVDNIQRMAANVVQIWEKGAAQMGLQARRNIVQRYSWERTFDTLLRQIYPEACKQAQMRTTLGCAHKIKNPRKFKHSA